MLSIIIPIYKVEQYLPQCLKSIDNLRKVTKLEVILVDDGSPDNCGKICDEYAAKHNDTKVIHQKNAGLSAARNAGIDAANGEYIWFIDSDDFLNEEASNVVKAIEKNDADIYFFGTRTCDEQGKVTGEIKRGLDTGYYSSFQVFQALRFPFSGVPFSIFRRAVFHDKRFKVGIISEDWQFILRAMVYAKKCYIVDATPYCYRIRNSGSITHSTKTFRYVHDDVDIAQDFYDCLKDNSISQENRKILYSGICAMLVAVRRLVINEIKDKKEKRRSLDYFLAKHFWKEALRESGNLKKRIQYLMLIMYNHFI